MTPEIRIAEAEVEKCKLDCAYRRATFDAIEKLASVGDASDASVQLEWHFLEVAVQNLAIAENRLDAARACLCPVSEII